MVDCAQDPRRANNLKAGGNRESDGRADAVRPSAPSRAAPPVRRHLAAIYDGVETTTDLFLLTTDRSYSVTNCGAVSARTDAFLPISGLGRLVGYTYLVDTCEHVQRVGGSSQCQRLHQILQLFS